MIDFPKNATIGDLYIPAMEITDEKEAEEYFESLVNWAVTKHGQEREKAVQIQKMNLGYFAGYYDSGTRERVERLFSCAHPIFGAISTNGQPTAEEALKAGLQFAKQ